MIQASVAPTERMWTGNRAGIRSRGWALLDVYCLYRNECGCFHVHRAVVWGLPFLLFLLPLSLPSLLSPSPLSFLFRFSSPRPPLSLKVFAQSGSAQSGSTFRSYNPVPPILMDAVEYLLHLCLLALSSPLKVAFLPPPHPFWNFLFLSLVIVCITVSSISQKRWAKVGPACGIRSGSFSCAHQFSHHSCTSTHLHTDLCLPTSSSPHLFLVTSHTSRPALSNGTLYTLIYTLTGSFPKKNSKSLNDISPFPPPSSTLWLLPLLSQHLSFPSRALSYSPHSPLTSYPPRRRLLCVVLRLLGDCPRAGLFATTTLSRPWNSVATTAWLGLALAAIYAFYAVFASPSQDKLSGIWGGCSFTFH